MSQVSDLSPGITVYGKLEGQLCSRTNKFKITAKEFLGWHFVSCCFGDILSDDALQLVPDHYIFLSKTEPLI
jgi:hypothetical protein